MRFRKLLLRASIGLVVVVVTAVLLLMLFVYNPLEGAHPDIRTAVPRNVDFFVRKEGLAGDFSEFPEPRFWTELRGSDAWRALQAGPAHRELEGQVGQAVTELRSSVRQLREARLDVLADVVGTELIVAGYMVPPALAAARWCAYTRVSWKVRLLWGVLGYGFARERAAEHGIRIEDAGERILKITVPDGQELFAARELDCLLVANDLPLLEESLLLARGMSMEDNFARTANYSDRLLDRRRGLEARAPLTDPSSVELFVRPSELFPIVSWDDGWPSAHAEDMNERVLASFFKLASWRYIAASLIFDRDSLLLTGDVTLNANEHTPFQRDFFRAEAQPRERWLHPFLSMVPDDAAAFAALRMPAGEFMREMFAALEPAARDLLDERLRATGQVQSVDELIRRLEIGLEPRTGFVFRKNRPDPGIRVANRAPTPQIAWTFWLRRGGQTQVAALVELLRSHYRTLGFEVPLKLPVGQSAEGDVALEFPNPQIPGTGEIALLQFESFFVLSNSGPLLRDMFGSRYGRRDSVMSRRDTTRALDEMPASVNGMLMVQGRELGLILGDYIEDAEDLAELVDPEFAVANIQRAEADVFRRDYAARYRSQAAMPPDVKREFEAAVDARLAELWRASRSRYGSGARDLFRQLQASSRLFRSAYLALEFEAQQMAVEGRITRSDW